MRKFFMTAVALLFCALTMMAQDGEAERNKMYRVTLGKIQYAHHNEKMSTNDAVGKALTGLVTGKIEVQATKYESDVKNAIIRGALQCLPLQVQQSVRSGRSRGRRQYCCRCRNH